MQGENRTDRKMDFVPTIYLLFLFMYKFIMFMYICLLLCICLCMFVGETHNLYDSARLSGEIDFLRKKVIQLHVMVGTQVV